MNREQLARDALLALCGNAGLNFQPPIAYNLADAAVDIADALIARLAEPSTPDDDIPF